MWLNSEKTPNQNDVQILFFYLFFFYSADRTKLTELFSDHFLSSVRVNRSVLLSRQQGLRLNVARDFSPQVTRQSLTFIKQDK